MEEIINEEKQLLEYLLIKFNKLSRNSVKNLLTNKQIVVNNKVITKYDYMLKKGDKISFNGKKENKKLKIIYEDNLFLVINKQAGLLSVATNKEKEKTAYVLANEYLKEKKSKAYVLHRLDKETSGVLVFCKDENIKNELQDKWNEIVTTREYDAIVLGKLKENKGSIKSYLTENKNGMVYSSNNKSGKLAITNYEVIKENDKYSELKVNLLTGRKNQIRVHLSSIGNPLLGDDKYGKGKDKRLYLHATKLEFIYKNRAYSFVSEIPQQFSEIMK